MEFVANIEKKVEHWLAALRLPKLPKVARTWLGLNIWWIVAIIAVISAIGVLFALGGILSGFATMAALPQSWVIGAVASWALVTSLINFVFGAAEVVFLGLSVNPLQLKQKKGWSYLFIVWLLNAAAAVVSVIVSILMLNAFTLISTIIFSGIFLAISGYLLFEVRAEFMHVEKTAGVKAKKKTKK